jgi:hypothetical protein
MINKNYWEMSDEEKEAMLAAGIKEEIAKHHAAGRATIHGDKGGSSCAIRTAKGIRAVSMVEASRGCEPENQR